jgi:hypothetical protein
MGKRRHDAERHVVQVLKTSGVDLTAFESAFIHSTPEEQLVELQNALQATAQFIDKLNENKDHADKELPAMYDFLKSIADMSPSFRMEMENQKIHDLKASELINNANNAATIDTLKRFLNYALAANTQSQLRRDLVESMAEYYRASTASMQESAKRLKQYLGNHHETAKQELAGVASNALENKSSNGMFDPLKVIGHLLNSMHHMKYIAPFDNEKYPTNKWKHKQATLEDDPQRKLWLKQTGGDLAPAGAPAAQGIPAPRMVPGVGG